MAWCNVIPESDFIFILLRQLSTIGENLRCRVLLCVLILKFKNDGGGDKFNKNKIDTIILICGFRYWQNKIA